MENKLLDIDTYFVQGKYKDDNSEYFESGFSKPSEARKAASKVCNEFEIYVRYNDGREKLTHSIKIIKK